MACRALERNKDERISLITAWQASPAKAGRLWHVNGST